MLLEGITVNSRTFGQVKDAAELAVKEAVAELVDSARIVTDDLKALADQVQVAPRPLNDTMDTIHFAAQ